LHGIENPAQFAREPLPGHLFENRVILDFAKNLFNQGRLAKPYFYRDRGKSRQMVYQSIMEPKGVL